MNTLLRGLALGLLLPLCSPSMVRGADRTPAQPSGDVLLSTMQWELQRAQIKLGQLDPAPYFTSYSVYDEAGMVVAGGLGSLLNSTQFHRRTGEVAMRVGSAALDNTHQESRPSGYRSRGHEFDSEDRLDPIPQSVVSPDLLLDELEVKRGDVAKQKLPEYPPPARTEKAQCRCERRRSCSAENSGADLKVCW